MAEFKFSGIEAINLGDKVFETKTEADKKHLKGYIFDSLMYRYIRAREQMAEYEFIRQNTKTHDKEWFYSLAKRDIVRFAQILDEVIKEHD